MARRDRRRDASDDLSDEMLDAYFQALANRAPAQPDLPLAEPPPTTVSERLPSAEELRPDLFLRNAPTTPPQMLGPPPRNEAERALEETSGLDYSEPFLNPAGGRRNVVGVLPPRSVLGPYEEEIIPSSSPFLGPQSELEREELRRHNRQVEGAVDAAMLAGTLAVPAGRAGAAVARGAAAAGRALTRAPRTVTAAVAGGATVAGTAETQQVDPADAARQSVERLRTRQGELEAQLKALQEAGGRFQPENLNRRDEAAVTAAQEFLQTQGLYLRDDRGRALRPDGRWGPGMGAAIDAYLRRNREEQENARGLMRDLATDLGRETRRLEGLEENLRVEDARRNVGPIRRFAREWGPTAAAVLGLYVGHRSRVRAVTGADLATERRVSDIDQLLTARPVVGGRSAAERAETARRFGNINEFWRLGGAGESVPFGTAQTARGFKHRPGAASPSSLFPPETTRFRGRDLGFLGAAATEIGVSGGALWLARRELAEAQTAFDRDKSSANIARLEHAHDLVATAEIALRLGLGAAGGRIGGALLHPYSDRRPNVAGAEAERALLNQLLARRRR